MYLSQFVVLYSWTIFFFVGFGLLGMMVLPFATHIRYSITIAPFAGILLYTVLVTFFYSFLGIVFTHAILVGGLLLIVLNALIIYYYKPKIYLDARYVAIILIASLIITYLCNYCSIMLGEPSLLYIDGSDQWGYAHLADWIRAHTAVMHPKASSHLPYESYPDAMLNQMKNRLGAFCFLAILSSIRQLPAAFMYNQACGVVLLSGLVGVSGIFSRKHVGFLLLLVGLMLSHWFDWASGGYLGKTLGYPAILFVLGLYTTQTRPLPASYLALMAIFSGAVVSVFMPNLALIVIGFTGVLFVLWTILYRQSSISIENEIAYLILLCFIIVATSGALALPNTFSGMPPLFSRLDWWTFIPHVFDIQSIAGVGYPITLSLVTAYILVILSVSISLFFFILARKKSVATVALITTAYLCLVLGWFYFSLSEYCLFIYELCGIFSPLILCGMVYFIESHLVPRTLLYRVTVFLCIVFISFTTLRFCHALDRFASNMALTLTIPMSEIDSLEKATESTHFTIGNSLSDKIVSPLLVGLGAHNANIQYEPKAWEAAVGYRHWSVPHFIKTKRRIERRGTPILPNCTLQFETRNYQLLDCH